MRKAMIAVAATAALAIPAVSLADQPSQQNVQNAQKFCRALRQSAGKDNFRAMFGGKKNAFGKCVSQNAKKDAQQDKTAHANAAKQCQNEQNADPAAFQQKYGNNKNGKDAMGKCVSQTAKADKQQMDQQETQNATNAARQCRTEKKSDPAAFQQKYGNNKNHKNAFGKCVSSKVKQEQQQEQSDSGSGGSS